MAVNGKGNGMLRFDNAVFGLGSREDYALVEENSELSGFNANQRGLIMRFILENRFAAGVERAANIPGIGQFVKP